MLPSRFPQQTFVQVAGREVEMVNVYTFSRLANGKRTPTRGKDSCSIDAYVTNSIRLGVTRNVYVSRSYANA